MVKKTKVEKLKIPKKIRVGGVDYKVFTKKTFKDDQGSNWGFHSYTTAIITLLLESDGVKMAECSILSTLLHELVHAVDYNYCNNNLEEIIVERLCDLWFQLLADNDLCIGKNELPKSIKILGKSYKVVKDYKFEECGKAPTVSIQPGNLEVKIGDIEKLEMNYEVLKIDLFECLTKVICCGAFISEEEMGNINVRSFSSGLYQVLKDSGIDKLIRRWCN